MESALPGAHSSIAATGRKRIGSPRFRQRISAIHCHHTNRGKLVLNICTTPSRCPVPSSYAISSQKVRRTLNRGLGAEFESHLASRPLGLYYWCPLVQCTIGHYANSLQANSYPVKLSFIAQIMKTVAWFIGQAIRPDFYQFTISQMFTIT